MPRNAHVDEFGRAQRASRGNPGSLIVQSIPAYQHSNDDAVYRLFFSAMPPPLRPADDRGTAATNALRVLTPRGQLAAPRMTHSGCIVVMRRAGGTIFFDLVRFDGRTRAMLADTEATALARDALIRSGHRVNFAFRPPSGVRVPETCELLPWPSLATSSVATVRATTASYISTGSGVLLQRRLVCLPFL